MTFAMKEATTEASPLATTPRRTEGWKNRVRDWLLVAVKLFVLSGALAATAGLSALLTFSVAIRGNEVTVPEVSGLDLASATQRLAQTELNLKVEGKRPDDKVAPDRITTQEPSPGATLKKGRSVKVWVSLGPPRRSVPRVEGETLRSAQLLLEQNGFTLGRISEVHSAQYSPDTVIAQNPPPYSEAGESTEIALLISRGYTGDAYLMPDFIGRDISDVLDQVRSAPIKINSIRYQEYAGVTKGLVVRQVPTAGSKVFARDAVVLYVSKGS